MIDPSVSKDCNVAVVVLPGQPLNLFGPSRLNNHRNRPTPLNVSEEGGGSRILIREQGTRSLELSDLKKQTREDRVGVVLNACSFVCRFFCIPLKIT